MDEPIDWYNNPKSGLLVVVEKAALAGIVARFGDRIDAQQGERGSFHDASELLARDYGKFGALAHLVDAVQRLNRVGRRRERESAAEQQLVDDAVLICSQQGIVRAP